MNNLLSNSSPIFEQKVMREIRKRRGNKESVRVTLVVLRIGSIGGRERGRKERGRESVITRRNDDNMEDKRLLELTKAPVVYYRPPSDGHCAIV